MRVSLNACVKSALMFFVFGFAAAPCVASADVLYLNNEGRVALKTTIERVYCVIRKKTRTGLTIDVRRGSKWYSFPTELKYEYLERVVDELDTFADLKRVRDKIIASLEGRSTEDVDIGGLVLSTLQQHARLEMSSRPMPEADPGLAKASWEMVDRLLNWGNGSPDKKYRAEVFKKFGTEARQAVIAAIERGLQRALDPKGKLLERELDPRVVSLVALKLVPKLTWELAGQERDSRALYGDVSKSLFDVISGIAAYRSLNQHSNSLTGQERKRNDVLNYEVWRQSALTYLTLAKKSKIPVEILIAEFSDNATHSTDSEQDKVNKRFRKQYASFLISLSSNSDSSYAKIGAETLVEMIHGQPAPREVKSAGEEKLKPEQFELYSLFQLVSGSSIARRVVVDKMSEIKGLIADKKDTKADKRLLSKLDRVMRAYQGQANSSQ